MIKKFEKYMSSSLGSNHMKIYGVYRYEPSRIIYLGKDGRRRKWCIRIEGDGDVGLFWGYADIDMRAECYVCDWREFIIKYPECIKKIMKLNHQKEDVNRLVRKFQEMIKMDKDLMMDIEINDFKI